MSGEVLTAAEKKKIEEEYITNTARINNALPEGNKIQLDLEGLRKRMEDPEEVARYRRGLAREEKLVKQSEIYAKLEKTYGKPPEGRHYLNRNIAFSFKTDGSTESEEYNEKLYKDYVENPEKLLYTKVQKLINSDPQMLYQAFDDNNALTDFYDVNQELCEDGFVIDSMIKDNAMDWITPELKDSLKSLKKPIEAYGDAKRAAASQKETAYFTMPKITPEQAIQIYSAGSVEFMATSADPKFRSAVLDAVNNATSEETTKEFYDKLKEEGFKLDNKFFIRHTAEKKDNNGEWKPCSFDEALKHKGDQNYSIRERTKDEIFHLRNISKEFERQYLGEWQLKYKDISGQDFNYEQIKDRNKGNIFERMFNRTSSQYKAFIKQLEDYNNPASKDYLNKEKLREKADAYEEHKRGQGKTYDQMDATSKGRMDLVKNVKDTLDYMEKADEAIRNKIDNKLYANPTERKSLGESFLNIEDVEERKDDPNLGRDTLKDDILKILYGSENENQNENLSYDDKDKFLGDDDGIDGLDELSN